MGCKSTKSLSIFFLLNLIFLAESQQPPVTLPSSCPLNVQELGLQCLEGVSFTPLQVSRRRLGECCSRLGGLAEQDLEACLCDLQTLVSQVKGPGFVNTFQLVIIDNCDLNVPTDFQCPA